MKTIDTKAGSPMKPIVILTLVSCGLLAAGCATKRGATFATPEEAVQRLIASSEDPDAAEELLGPGGGEMMHSGDDVADRQEHDHVVEMARQKLVFDDVQEGRKIAVLGHESWEMPIPLVQESGRWRFDAEAGRQEIWNRRVGRNELSTIETLRELVEAQREYVSTPHAGNPPAYARRIVSSEGKRDGLYWPVGADELPSPLGEFVAEAFEEGYRSKKESPLPYHGYFFRLLTSQGPKAPGGAMNYIDAQDRLTRGFAVIAWPATYNNSGVKTFMVNDRGIVYEKDLGVDTAKAAAAIQAFDLDKSWMPTGG